MMVNLSKLFRCRLPVQYGFIFVLLLYSFIISQIIHLYVSRDWQVLSVHHMDTPAIHDWHREVSTPCLVHNWTDLSYKLLRIHLLRKKLFCNDSVTVWGKSLVKFDDILVNVSKARARAIPGSVAGETQPEKDEVYTLDKGFFSRSCDLLPIDEMPRRGHLLKWYSVLKIKTNFDAKQLPVEKNFTVVLQRQEYANVFWTIIDTYNVFLLKNFFNKSCDSMIVLVLDARPYSPVQELLFQSFATKRLPDLPPAIIYQELVWSPYRDSSPLLTKTLEPIPLLEPFRHHVLHSLGVNTSQSKDCARHNFNLLFICRRDYVAHPRNPTGIISRKISNEQELVTALQTTFPTLRVEPVQLDQLTIAEQLEKVSRTDILLGMHGAGMALSAFLPPGSAVIELWPTYSGYNWHMEYIARRSQHLYYSWRNRNVTLDDLDKKTTTVPVSAVHNLVYQAMIKLCQKPVTRSPRRRHIVS